MPHSQESPALSSPWLCPGPPSLTQLQALTLNHSIAPPPSHQPGLQLTQPQPQLYFWPECFVCSLLPPGLCTSCALYPGHGPPLFKAIPNPTPYLSAPSLSPATLWRSEGYLGLSPLESEVRERMAGGAGLEQKCETRREGLQVGHREGSRQERRRQKTLGDAPRHRTPSQGPVSTWSPARPSRPSPPAGIGACRKEDSEQGIRFRPTWGSGIRPERSERPLGLVIQNWASSL